MSNIHFITFKISIRSSVLTASHFSLRNYQFSNLAFLHESKAHKRRFVHHPLTAIQVKLLCGREDFFIFCNIILSYFTFLLHDLTCFTVIKQSVNSTKPLFIDQGPRSNFEIGEGGGHDLKLGEHNTLFLTNSL